MKTVELKNTVSKRGLGNQNKAGHRYQTFAFHKTLQVCQTYKEVETELPTHKPPTLK
jgi:hypothetical protein